MRWISLVGWVGLCLAVGGISGRWTIGEVKGWYRTLIRPTFAPPDRVFGPVWSLLYLMMAVAAWRIWESAPSPMRSWGIVMFLLQLGLNFAWTWIFFRHHAIGPALIEIVVLWLAIALTILLFWQVSPLAALLMLPYLVWVSFAAVLNWGFWRLN